MAKYLDLGGLSTLWAKIKDALAGKQDKLTAVGSSTSPIYIDEDGKPQECTNAAVTSEKASWLSGYRKYSSGTTYGACLKAVGREGLAATNSVGCEFLLKCGHLSNPQTFNTYRCHVLIRGEVADVRMDLIGGTSSQMWKLCAIRDVNYHYGIYLVPVSYVSGSGWVPFGKATLDVTVLPIGVVAYDSTADGETGWKTPEPIDEATATAALTSSFAAFSEKPSFYDATINSVGNPNVVKCDRIVSGANLVAANQASSTGQLAGFDKYGMLLAKTATVGSATTPVYLNAGVPTACSGASLVASYYDANIPIPLKASTSCTETDYSTTTGIAHFYDPAKNLWSNCSSTLTSTQGEITTVLVSSLNSSTTIKESNVTTLRIVSVSRTGTQGSIVGYFTPYPYVSGYPYYVGAVYSESSSFRKGVEPADCNAAAYTLSSILTGFTGAVGGSQCLYTGGKNIHAYFEGDTLRFSSDSFGDFTKNAQYFFHIPLVFPTAI